jgi:flagellar motor switch protein FliG
MIKSLARRVVVTKNASNTFKITRGSKDIAKVVEGINNKEISKLLAEVNRPKQVSKKQWSKIRDQFESANKQLKTRK